MPRTRRLRVESHRWWPQWTNERSDPERSFEITTEHCLPCEPDELDANIDEEDT